MQSQKKSFFQMLWKHVFTSIQTNVFFELSLFYIKKPSTCWKSQNPFKGFIQGVLQIVFIENKRCDMGHNFFAIGILYHHNYSTAPIVSFTQSRFQGASKWCPTNHSCWVDRHQSNDFRKLTLLQDTLQIISWGKVSRSHQLAVKGDR